MQNMKKAGGDLEEDVDISFTDTSNFSQQKIELKNKEIKHEEIELKIKKEPSFYNTRDQLIKVVE